MPFTAIWCLHAAFHNNAQRESSSVLLTMTERLCPRSGPGHKASQAWLALTLSIDCFYGIAAVKCALTDRSCHWQDKCFALQRARSLMSPAMTFLPKVSDTTYGPLRVTASWCR